MIYLDYAATSYKKPQVVIDAVCTALQGMGNAGRGVNDASLGAARLLYETRLLLSDFFHGYGAAQTVFTCNSTEALNTAIQGVLQAGDHVITTMLEHNSVLRPLYSLQEKGLELSILQADEKGRIHYEDFEDSIRSNTKAIVCTHASNLTGNKVDLKTVGEVCQRHGLLFIVDASQTAGVFPIDMQEMGIDLLCVTGHKSLLGPQGTGALLVREGLQLAPLKVGGSGIETYNHRHPLEMPVALEAGTLNTHGIAGLRAGVKYLMDTGIEAIHQREIALAKRFYEGIREIPEVQIYGDFDSWDRAAIVTLNIGDYDSAAVSDALLTDYGIQVRSGGHCAPLMHEALGTKEQGAVRFSFGWCTSAEEVDAAINAIRELSEED